jgi:hypothetical protein
LSLSSVPARAARLDAFPNLCNPGGIEFELDYSWLIVDEDGRLQLRQGIFFKVYCSLSR